MRPEDFAEAPHPLAWRSRRERWTEIARAVGLFVAVTVGVVSAGISFRLDLTGAGWFATAGTAFLLVLLFAVVLDITERDALTTREF